LDFEPLPNTVEMTTQPLAAARFARNVRELLNCIDEYQRESH
jgi:hypothetical protein